MTGRRGFSLVELLVVIAILALLMSILLPSLAAARHLARRAVCQANLKAVNTAFLLYLQDSGQNYFPYVESSAEGNLWYWGLETLGGPEGSREIRKDRARLAPYFSHPDRMKVCPEIPWERSDFKPKFQLAGYGYAINRNMLAEGSKGLRHENVTHASDTAAWADSMQINTWQPPASASNPMLEEWYYLDNRAMTPASFHFRHVGACNVAYADGSVRSLDPVWLDGRCDGLVGRPEPPAPPAGVTPLLKLDK